MMIFLIQPPASQPANHEITGFMPGRKDFETEFDNDAEQTIKDIEITEEDTKHDIGNTLLIYYTVS